MGAHGVEIVRVGQQEFHPGAAGARDRSDRGRFVRRETVPAGTARVRKAMS
jgi:hypothetical protein